MCNSAAIPNRITIIIPSRAKTMGVHHGVVALIATLMCVVTLTASLTEAATTTAATPPEAAATSGVSATLTTKADGAEVSRVGRQQLHQQQPLQLQPLPNTAGIDGELTARLGVDQFFALWLVFNNDDAVVVSDKPFTIFAPRNAIPTVFDLNITSNTSSPSSTTTAQTPTSSRKPPRSEAATRRLLLDHVVLGFRLDLANVTSHLSVTTLGGRTVRITNTTPTTTTIDAVSGISGQRALVSSSGSATRVNNATVLEARVEVPHNGILIVVDRYLFEDDEEEEQDQVEDAQAIEVSQSAPRRPEVDDLLIGETAAATAETEMELNVKEVDKDELTTIKSIDLTSVRPSLAPQQLNGNELSKVTDAPIATATVATSTIAPSTSTVEAPTLTSTPPASTPAPTGKEHDAKSSTFVDNVLQVLSYLKSGVRVFQHFLSRSNVTRLLKQGEEYTVFVPTDHAFQRWHPIDWGFYPFSVPEFTESVIINHFVRGRLKQEDIANGFKARTLGGRDVTFRKTPASLAVNGATVVKGDTPVSDGNIMFVSEVLFVSEAIVSKLHQQHRDKETPPLLAFPWFGAQFLSHAFLALERDRRFTHITRFLNLADLAPHVAGAGYTFFVPTDTAFEELGLDKMPDNYLSTGEGLDILLNHFVKGRLYDRDLKPATELRTLGNRTATVRRDKDTVYINDAKIVESEVFVYNLGTMFYIDQVLFVNRSSWLIPHNTFGNKKTTPATRPNTIAEFITTTTAGGTVPESDTATSRPQDGGVTELIPEEMLDTHGEAPDVLMADDEKTATEQDAESAFTTDEVMGTTDTEEDLDSSTTTAEES